MRATRRHVRREVGIGMRLPAYYDEVAGEVAEQNVVLDLRVLCGTSHAEAHVPVRGSVERVPCGLNVRLPDAHVTAVVFSGATVDMLEILLRTGAKTAAGGEHDRDEKGIALIMLNNSRDSGAAAPLALTCAEDAQDRVGASKDARTGDRGLGDGHASDLEHHSLVRFAVEVHNIAVVIPRGARKAHFRTRDIGDPTLPHHLGYEELDLVVSLQGTAIDRADLDVVLVVLPELHDAGVAAVVRVLKP